MKQFHEDLINQALEAARAGDRDSAYELVKDIVEEDPTNIRAWLLLARFTKDVQERMMAVTSVLNLDPTNESALKLKAQAEAQLSQKDDSEIIPGISRRQFQFIAIGSGVILILVLVIVVTIISGNQREEAQRNTDATLAVLQSTNARRTETQIAILQTEERINETETQIALESPTPTASNTSNAPTLPPTITPTPLPSDTPTFAPIESLPGQVLAWGGVDLANRDALPLLLYSNISPDSQPIEINTPDGRLPVFPDNGSVIAYSRYVPQEVDFRVELIDLEGAAVSFPMASAITEGGFINSDMASLSSDGSRLIFIGDSVVTNTDEVYLLSLDGTTINGQTVVQLTNDASNYSFPSLSPDGSQIVVARNFNNTTDLVIIDVNDRTQVELTSDGNAIIETTPRWNNSANLIAYAGSSDNGRNSDLYLIAPDNPGSEFKVIDHPADDRLPVFSPDGRYLAFATNRSGSYDIFIFNLANQDLFQMTRTEREDIYPGSWIDG